MACHRSSAILGDLHTRNKESCQKQVFNALSAEFSPFRLTVSLLHVNKIIKFKKSAIELCCC